VDRSPAATRQLASRARRRVRGGAPAPDADLRRQREVVEAFLAAAREGDFEGLLAVLDPDVVLRADLGAQASRIIRGAEAVAQGAIMFRKTAPQARPALVNGTIGAVSSLDGQPFSVVGFTVSDGRIVAIDVLADPDRLRDLDLSVLDV
jgi:RNA polymerase sigma-70 factor (ECF subfamily)